MIRLFKRSILATFVIFLLILPVAKAQPDIQTVKHNIQQRLDEDHLLGISIAYVYPDGHVKYFSEGFLSTDRNQKVNKHTIFKIGSVTETFTTLIFARMVTQYKIFPDDPIDNFLPDSVQAPSYKGHKITLLHLATHTSGLPRIPSNFSRSDTLNPYANYKIDDLYRFLNQYKLTEAPGPNFQYSNIGIGLLGHLLAQASGKSYEQLLHNYIIAPLVMFDTGITLSQKKPDRFAKPYHDDQPLKQGDFTALKGAGGIRSTAKNMATYIKAQMGMLNTNFEEVIKTTHQIQFNKGSDDIDAVGLAWMRSTKKDTIIFHSGQAGGFYSFIGYNAEKNRGVVVLANGEAPMDDIGFHMLDNRHLLKEPQAPKQQQPLKQSQTSNRSQTLNRSQGHEKQKIVNPVKLGIEILNKYTGTYLTTNGDKYFVFRRGNQLRVELAGHSSQKVFAKSEHRFFFKSKPVEIEFSHSIGSAPSFTLYKNGREITGNRVNTHKVKSQSKTTNHYSSLLKQYEGIYKISVGDYITITKEGNQLMVQPTGQQSIPAKLISKTKFSLKSIDVRIEFIKGKDGVYNKMKIYKSGQVTVATRL